MKLARARQSVMIINESSSEKLLQYNRLLSELNHSKRFFDCLKLFTQIVSVECLKPDHYTFSNALAACANRRDVAFGSQLHGLAVRAGFRAYTHVANNLLSLYSKTEDMDSVKRVFGEIENPDAYSWTTLLSACVKLGDIHYACEIFDQMPKGSVACWNALVTGCAETGHDWVAMNMFGEMHRIGVRHDNYTFASVLSLCSMDILDFGQQVHGLVAKTGFLCKASVVNALLTMYFSSKNERDAYAVFEEAEAAEHVCDEITYNAMIDGFFSMGRDDEAYTMFREMQEAGLRPTELTFVSVMSSCSVLHFGHQLHSRAIKLGFETSTSVSNATIRMYSSCGDLNAAYMVFQSLEEKDLISWNSMISSYAQGGIGRSAISTFLQMQRAGTGADEFTFGSLLASSESTETVEMVQALVSKNGMIRKIQVLNALVSAYSKHGNISQAYLIFNDISAKNLISWNTMISGLLLNGKPMEVLEQFYELLMSEVQPNAYTLSIVLSTCSSISSLTHGKQVHCYILRTGSSSETSLGNALITMYAKCGLLDWSLRVFNAVVCRDTVSWNAMISAYSQHGHGKDAVHCFESMQKSSEVKPDHGTFTAVLSACSHAGLVNDGSRIFDSMVKTYGLIPGVDQLSCVVDLLGRAGYLDEAESITESKHYEGHSNILWTLFSACAAHGNLRLGRVVAGLLLETEQEKPSVYVLLSNIYASAGRWEEAAKVRELMKRNGKLKQPGCSWIR